MEVIKWAIQKMMVGEWVVQAVMSMYGMAKTVVKTSHGINGKPEVKVGVHQGSVFSSFLFVMEALTSEIREDLPWKTLFADDLMLVAECMESMKEVLVWKKQMKGKEMYLNVKKTKDVLSGKNYGETDRSAQWPCNVWKECRK